MFSEGRTLIESFSEGQTLIKSLSVQRGTLETGRDFFFIGLGNYTLKTNYKYISKLGYFMRECVAKDTELF